MAFQHLWGTFQWLKNLVLHMVSYLFYIMLNWCPALYDNYLWAFFCQPPRLFLYLWKLVNRSQSRCKWSSTNRWNYFTIFKFFCSSDKNIIPHFMGKIHCIFLANADAGWCSEGQMCVSFMDCGRKQGNKCCFWTNQEKRDFCQI